MKNKEILFLRRTAATLAALLLCVALCGCGFIEITYPGGSTAESTGDTPIPGTSEAGSTAALTDPPTTVVFPDRISEAEAKLDALPELSFTAHDLIIANSAATTGVFEPEEDDALNSARTRRTEMACEKYGIEISVVSAADDEMLSEFIMADKSGSYYADFAVIPAASAAGYYNAGIALNLRSLPFVELPGDPTSPEGAGIAGSACYFYCGAATLDPDSVWALYFNRTLAGAQLTDSLYRTALGSAGLSWEDLFTAVSACALPDGVYSAVSGTLSTADFVADAVCASFGVDFVSADAGGAPYVAYDEKKYTAAGEMISRLAGILYLPADENSKDPLGVFADGGALFRFGSLSDIRSLYNKKTEWGILPLPRADATAGNVTVCGADRPVILYAGGGSRLELCGAALAAMDAASGAWLCDAYADAAFDSCLRDNNSYLTLRAILDGSVEFDFSALYAGATDKLISATYGAARAQLRGGTPLSAAVKEAKSAADRELSRLFG